MPGQTLQHRADRYRRSQADRVPVDAGADRRKADASNGVCGRQVETRQVCRAQQLRLAARAVTVNGANRVKDESRGQTPGAGGDRAACGTTALAGANRIQLRHNRRAARPVNRAIHAASARKRAIGGIRDRLRRDACDVATKELDGFAAGAVYHSFMVRSARKALVLFDIDGTLVRRAGEHHRQALIDAVRAELGIETTMDGLALQGMLDVDILSAMLRPSGAAANRSLAAIIERAQSLYESSCPDLRDKLCPAVEQTLGQLAGIGAPLGLVTGNLTRIGWTKLERAGLRGYFQFGAFAEEAATRAELAAIAISRARDRGLAGPETAITLIGDHPNDVEAAKLNGIRSIAVATGIAAAEELRSCSPDHLLPDLGHLRLSMLY